MLRENLTAACGKELLRASPVSNSSLYWCLTRAGDASSSFELLVGNLWPDLLLPLFYLSLVFVESMNA